jgi:hypothetical protein
MFEMVTSGTVLDRMDQANAAVGRAHRTFLELVVQADAAQAWRGEGARDTAHLLGIRYGISAWKAHRWVATARALERLPRLALALERGELGIDKAVELARFATPRDEARLIRWAQQVSCGAVRRRGDLAERASRQETTEPERDRFLQWWYTQDGRRLGLEAELPAAQGAVVVRTIERMAREVPAMPGEEDVAHARTRRADALVALCSARLAADPDPDRATVVVHARLEGLVTGSGGCELEDGPVIPPDVARRLACDARVQTVVEDAGGNVLALGRMRREPPAAMVRQVRYRDRGCRFPGCGTRAFTQAHHIVWWRHGGRTDLDNLLLICSFHHRLVHEYGWRVRREPDGGLGWFRPDGRRYRAGPRRAGVRDGSSTLRERARAPALEAAAV